MSEETAAAAPEETPAPPVVTTAAADVHVLSRFSELDALTARTITASAQTRLIVIAGMNGSGKTTLVASIYERFLRGTQFAGYAFAGSETLIGFEQRCHLARVASGLTRPQTERTRVSERMALLHWRVTSADGRGGRRDLLFTDIFGEAFQEAKDSTAACRRMTFLPRADRVVVLIDGKQLIDDAARLPAVACVDDFLRRAIDCGMLGKRSNIDIATAKWDDVLRLPEPRRASVEPYLSDVEARIREDFGGSMGSLRTARLAARPAPPSTLAVGYGVDGLFPSWVEEGRPDPAQPTPQVRLGSEIDRYARPSMPPISSTS